MGRGNWNWDVLRMFPYLFIEYCTESLLELSQCDDSVRYQQYKFSVRNKKNYPFSVASARLIFTLWTIQRVWKVKKNIFELFVILYNQNCLKFPDSQAVSEDAKDLIGQLLIEKNKRLNFIEIKNHSFFLTVILG